MGGRRRQRRLREPTIGRTWAAGSASGSPRVLFVGTNQSLSNFSARTFPRLSPLPLPKTICPMSSACVCTLQLTYYDGLRGKGELQYPHRTCGVSMANAMRTCAGDAEKRRGASTGPLTDVVTHWSVCSIHNYGAFLEIRAFKMGVRPVVPVSTPPCPLQRACPTWLKPNLNQDGLSSSPKGRPSFCGLFCRVENGE
ncbi:hypothetical protein BC826DRAFT_524327 [Russula brevipes]|nr:hypothetical protein BC826DRAFT_524327 [Russula brevipes]